MLWNPKDESVDLQGFYRGSPAFLVCSGPSLSGLDLEVLGQPGILLLAVNNAVAAMQGLRPQLWTCADPPGKFCEQIWLDPGILKFVPGFCGKGKRIYWNARIKRSKDDGQFKSLPYRVRNCPSTLAYKRRGKFDPETFLTDSKCQWGVDDKKRDSIGMPGTRSVFLVAIWLLYYLGVRTVYLLGCDFHMTLNQPYAFPEIKKEGDICGNNAAYKILDMRLQSLAPHFQDKEFSVANCNPETRMRSLPYVPFEEAVQHASGHLPKEMVTFRRYSRGNKKKR